MRATSPLNYLNTHFTIQEKTLEYATYSICNTYKIYRMQVEGSDKWAYTAEFLYIFCEVLQY